MEFITPSENGLKLEFSVGVINPRGKIAYRVVYWASTPSLEFAYFRTHGNFVFDWQESLTFFTF